MHIISIDTPYILPKTKLESNT